MSEGIDAEPLGKEGSSGNSDDSGCSCGEEECAGGIGGTGGIGGMGGIDARPGTAGGAGGTGDIGKPCPVDAASVCPNENPDPDDEGVVKSLPV